MIVSHRHDAIPHPPMQGFLDDRGDSRLTQRIAGNSYLSPPLAHQRTGNNMHFVSSVHTSMLLAGSDETNHSLAALTNASTMASTRSVSSSVGARQLDQSQRTLDQEHDALVIAPLRGPRVLECPFNFVMCFLTFSNMEDWINHSLRHFCIRSGRVVGPPTYNTCCFCDDDFQCDDAHASWKLRMHHVAIHHQLGHRLAHARPDFVFFRYLWEKRLMSDKEYRELSGCSKEPPIAKDRTAAEGAYPSPPQSPNGGRARVLQGGFQESYSSTRRRRENPRRPR